MKPITQTGPENHHSQRRTWFRFLQLVPFAWILIWLLTNITVLPLSYRKDLANLEHEFDQLTPPPNAVLLKYETKAVTDRATITATYESTSNFQAIKEFYDLDLAEHGWQYFRKDPYTVDYCKGDFTITLDHSNFSFYPNYEIWLSSGVTSSCEMSKGGGIIWMPFSDLVFMLGCSATFWLPYAVIMGWAGWGMRPLEFQRFKSGLISKPSGIWQARIWAVASLLIGLLMLWVSIYKIASYAINW